jgi:hypothetical protein
VLIKGTLIVTALALLAGAPAAQAAKLRIATNTITVNGGAGSRGVPVSAVARCPKGTKAVAGGYETSPPQSPARRVAVVESIMVKGTGWRVTGFESAPAPASDGLTAYAYCGKRKRALMVGSPIRTDFIPEPGHSTSSAAKCPPHTSAFSGGFSAPSGDVYFFRSRRDGRFWEAGVTNVSGSGGAPYTVEAYCGRGKVITRRMTQPVADPGTGQVTATPPRCPKRTRALSGGFDSAETTGSLSIATLVFRTRLLGGTWIASGVSGGVAGAVVSSYSYCRA